MQRIEQPQPLAPIDSLKIRLKTLNRGLNHFDKVQTPKAMTPDVHAHFLATIKQSILDLKNDNYNSSIDTDKRDVSIQLFKLIEQYKNYRDDEINKDTEMPPIPDEIDHFKSSIGGRYKKKTRKLFHKKRNNRKKYSNRRKH